MKEQLKADEHKELWPSIEDNEEAEHYIKELLEKGERPIVSVPKKYENELKNGLKAHSSWIPGIALIVGVLGREPYSAKEEQRIFIKIKEIDPNNIKPRFTGDDKKFHGIVVIDGPVAPNAIENFQK